MSYEVWLIKWQFYGLAKEFKFKYNSMQSKWASFKLMIGRQMMTRLATAHADMSTFYFFRCDMHNNASVVETH